MRTKHKKSETSNDTERTVSKPVRAKWSIGRKLLLLSASVFALLCVFAGSLYMMSMNAWQSFDINKITNAQQTLRLFDAENNLITNVHGTENRLLVGIEKIPEHVKNAFIATEDVRFYQHSGVDIKRIFGAIIADIKSGSLDQGASTITQQLIKLSHLTSEKTFSRKIQEALLSIQLERNYSKDEILEMYLNYVYFGAGAYGVQAAAQEYFGKDISELSYAQGAMLAGIVKSPSRYAPHLNLEKSIERRDLILSLMNQNGFLSNSDYEKSLSETVVLQARSDSQYPHGFYTELAMMQAREALNIDQEQLLSGGYQIYTALNTTLQTECETLFADNSLFPANVGEDNVEAAISFIDPKNYKIVALLGGREHYVKFGLNRATQLKRQPGSAIKPVIVYAPALETFGYTAASLMLDQQTEFGDYAPKNFNNSYYGWVTMRQAITQSLNVPAVSLLSNIGVSSGKNFAQKVGITFDKNDNSLSLALGGFTYGVSPLELCSAYTSFASGGLYAPSSCIVKITDADGNELYTPETHTTRVMSESNAFILNSMLTSVITEGTGRRLNIGIPLAGKTGTTGLKETGGNKDAWMVAYNSDYVATIWMGFDNTNSEHSLPAEATGGTYPAAILSRAFQSLYPDKTQAPSFIQPESVVKVNLDAISLQDRQKLLLANALTPTSKILTEYFAVGTEPNTMTDYWRVPSPPSSGEITVDAALDGKPVINFLPSDRFVLYKLYRESNNVSVLLGEFPGDDGTITYFDDSAEYLVQYEYYVIPVHPELNISGEPVEGPSSHRYLFTPLLPPAQDDSRYVTNSDDESLSDRLDQTPIIIDPFQSQNPGASATPSQNQAQAQPQITPTPAPEPTDTPLPKAFSTPTPLSPSPTPTPATPKATQKPTNTAQPTAKNASKQMPDQSGAILALY